MDRNAFLKRYSSRSVLFKKDLLEVIKKSLKPCSIISLIHENRFNPFFFVLLATPLFEILWHHKKMTLQNLLLSKHRVAFSANFATSSFCHATKFRKRKVANYGVKRIKSIFANKGNNGTRFATLLYYLNYFFFFFSIKPISSYISLIFSRIMFYFVFKIVTNLFLSLHYYNNFC